MPEPPGNQRRRRPLRLVARVLLGLVALVVLLVAVVVFLLGDLDRPWIKSRVVALVKDGSGIGIDYDGLGISLLHGVHAHTLRVLTPAGLSAAAPDFVRVEGLELDAPLWAVALGERNVAALRIHSIELAVVQDESGRTSLTELLPPRAKPKPEENAPLSQTLARLPSAVIQTLDIDAMRARWIELRSGVTPRVTTFGTLGLLGNVKTGPEGLLGTDLRLGPAPSLRLEQTDEYGTRRADLALDVHISGADAQTLGIVSELGVHEQNWVPMALPAGPLFALAAQAHFDAKGQQTRVALSNLSAWGGALSASADANVFDAPALHVLANGKAAAHLAALPVALEGLAFSALDFEVGARDLAWDPESVKGALDWQGRLQGLRFEQAQGSAEAASITLQGQGDVAAQGGTVRANADVSGLRWKAPDLSATLGPLKLSLNGTLGAANTAQDVVVESDLTLDDVHVQRADGQLVTLANTSLKSHLKGTVAGLRSRSIPELTNKLTLDRLTASAGRQTTSLEQLSFDAALAQIAPDTASPFGVNGTANLAFELPSLGVSEGSARGPRKSLASASGLSLRVSGPLSLARVTGTLGLATAKTPEASLGDLALDLDVTHPLGFSNELDTAAPGTPQQVATKPASAEPAGDAELSMKGKLGRFSAGKTRGAFDDVRLVAQRPERDLYRLELDATGSSLVAQGALLPGRLTAKLSAEAAPHAGKLTLSGGLGSERGELVDLNLAAHFDRPSNHLGYRAKFSVDRLGAFAPALAGLAPQSSQVELAKLRVEASAEGDFSGVLRAQGDALPAPTPNPLASARGHQKLDLALQGLDYRAADRSVTIPELKFAIESEHHDQGAGKAQLSLRAPKLSYAGGGSSIALTGLDQTLEATFDRAPDQGVVNVGSQTSIASVAQSWLPAYPIRQLHMTSNLELDHLHSILLRALAIENPEAGARLSASGALELRTQGTPSGGKSIVGREALSFEGRVDQALEPLQRLGVAGEASGTLAIPFRLESGGLLGYRFLATLEAHQVSFTRKDGALQIDRLSGSIPIVEEFALLPSGPVLSEGPRVSPLADTRFFDVHPFLSDQDYVTADSIRFGGLQTLGPLAANVRIERTDFLIDQLQAGYRGGQIVGQVRVAYRDGDPIVRLRVNVTGLHAGKSNDLLDANTALTFVPTAMTLDGKMQIVRASRQHLLDILDVIDPFHESANANRVRRGLALGYPKFVRFQLHDGAVDTKVELGGLAELVRIDEIKAVPLGPILQRYVAPQLAPYLHSAPEPGPLTSKSDDDQH